MWISGLIKKQYLCSRFIEDKKSNMITSLVSVLLLPLMLVGEEQDSLRIVSLDEVNVVSNVKEIGTLRQQPSSSTHISGTQIADKGINDMRAVGTLAPNFFVPDYGSKQTSAIYMRGVGARIGTPSVGLYVDNVPYYDKSAFDFSFYDVESIDVLRGPQSTLYGRNAMSGLVRIHTHNPFVYAGTDVRLGFSTKDNKRKASLTHYHKVGDDFAFSVGGFYEGGDGFFRNEHTGKRVDGIESGGGRLRAIWKTNERLTLDANVSYEYSDEGTYPYYYTGVVSGTEAYEDFVGKISSNLEGRYRRGLFNASLNTEFKTDAVTLNSVTAYQNIDDRMFMDQDFLFADIYSLEQRQKINTISEELLLKNNGRKAWNWIVGANVFYQSQDIVAPVSFRKDGVDWLNSVINVNANKYMPPIAAGPMTMNFLFADNIQGDVLRFDDDFSAPVFGAALFHQSTFNDLFGIDGLNASIGLRLDYEKMKLDYKAWYDFEHTYSLKGKLTPMNREIVMVSEENYHVSNSSLYGKVSNDYLQVLPKLSLMYNFEAGNVYATISRGYRSGGYSVQNISEILRSQMQVDMMKQVRDVTVPVLEKQTMVPADKKEVIVEILDKLATDVPADVEGYCGYKPEYAWNYEIGTHLGFFEKKLTMDLSAFLINVSDLQLSKMSETGLGRAIINAGSSRSVGFEMAARVHPLAGLSLGASYGLTNATFRKYGMYDEVNKVDVDCKGNKVPYVPSNTFTVDAAYTLDFSNCMVKSATLGIDYSYVGKIFWDEVNMHSQSSYGMLGASMKLEFSNFDVQLWGHNLTDAKYNTFWFESMGKGFEQHGKPLQVGLTVSMHL